MYSRCTVDRFAKPRTLQEYEKIFRYLKIPKNLKIKLVLRFLNKDWRFTMQKNLIAVCGQGIFIYI